MAKREKLPGKVNEPEAARNASGTPITLTAAMSKKTQWTRFDQWLIGAAPLICHAWSHKAKQEMLAKMVKAVQPGREQREPEEEFLSSLYEMPEVAGSKTKQYGFPVTAVKKAILNAAHKDRGVPKTDVRSALWLDFDIVSTRPALASAICDMPLVRVWSGPPQMREDMTRVRGSANFAYRAQFFPWAIRLSGKFNSDVLSGEALAFLVDSGGMGCGVGDWRVEKDGVFGTFWLAGPEEAEEWKLFAAGKGPLPRISRMGMQEAAE
jgi:hypothetical protein